MLSTSIDELQELFLESSLAHILRDLELQDIVNDGASFTSYTCCTAYDLYTRYRGVELGIPEIDGALQGGVPSGFVVEIAGPSGAGKSRLSALIAARHAVSESLRLYTQGGSQASEEKYTCCPSVLFLKADYHACHAVRTLSEAVRYHSTLAWEKSSLSSTHSAGEVHSMGVSQEEGEDPAHGLPLIDPEYLAQRALSSISVVDVASDLDALLRDEGLRGASDPLTDVLRLIEGFLAKCAPSTSAAGADGAYSPSSPSVVVLDSVGTLIRRVYTGDSGDVSGVGARHDAIAAFLQGLKDTAAMFNAVIFITNQASGIDNVFYDEGGGEEDEGGRHFSSIRGTFGTTFYHAVNIRLLLLPSSKSSHSAVLHIAKSPICSSRTFVLGGLLEELNCYESVRGGAHGTQSYRLRPSVRVIETLA